MGKISIAQLRRMVNEAINEDDLYDLLSGSGPDRYDLYMTEGGIAAAEELDDLMEEVSNFMNDARARLESIKTKYEDGDSGITDGEAVDAIGRVFGKAILGRFKR